MISVFVDEAVEYGVMGHNNVIVIRDRVVILLYKVSH
jgi:hypothetical protein